MFHKKKELTIPKGDASYRFFKDIALIFLKVGGFCFVNNIGNKAADVITDIKINGWKFLGLLKLSKNIPMPIDP